jgi:hypothetical protein
VTGDGVLTVANSRVVCEAKPPWISNSGTLPLWPLGKGRIESGGLVFADNGCPGSWSVKFLFFVYRFYHFVPPVVTKVSGDFYLLDCFLVWLCR